MKKTGRSGQYIQQLTGYKAFIPLALPPDPPIEMDGEMLLLNSQADRELGRLDGSIQTLLDSDLFIYMYIRKEAVLSSQIEGTQSSINDVLDAEANVFRPHRPKDVSEVISYIHAMNYGISRLKTLPVSVRLIKEIHKELLTGVRGEDRQPGEIRTSQNWIGPEGCTLRDASFVPPPPEIVGAALSDLEKFIHSDSQLPILIKIGLAHAQFETIHPFLDGNGRVGRLLITFLLVEPKILQWPVLYLSYYFKRYREQYYNLLQGVRDSGDWESWLKFFLSAVLAVSKEAMETARGIVSLREEHRKLIIEEFGRSAANGIMVLESLYSRPIISVSDITALTGISFTAANNLMNRFVATGILLKATDNERNRKFSYEKYISFFTGKGSIEWGLIGNRFFVSRSNELATFPWLVLLYDSSGCGGNRFQFSPSHKGSDRPPTHIIYKRLPLGRSGPSIAAVMREIPSRAPIRREMSPGRDVSGSFGLIRMRGAPRDSPKRRTVGTDLPAPISITTSRRTVSFQRLHRDIWSRVLSGFQPLSSNMRMLGRARPRQRGQRGSSERRRADSRSTSGENSSELQISRPQLPKHCM